ncbi:type II secretion system protein GspC [Vibrio hannami]|uniref:type II secretion system protein GspC n=1 Tax=Vibrio hannami TaxID=2717094 RepID=UPI00240EE1F8|nr:type II secretion system protein GspC [Vibrio hannami]MDG3086851.1 type II secretion system protein GspC [Vibrio hannami]
MSFTLSPSDKVNRFFSVLFRGLINSQAKFSLFFTAVFVSLSAWIVGELIWYSAESSSTTQWRAQQSVSATQESANFDTKELKQANLFGLYSEKTEPVKRAVVVQDAPKTRLSLTLVGVVASSNDANSLAVISNRGVQATYGIDESIEGTRARLKAVLVDRVIIDNSGRNETLMLQGIDYSKRVVEPEDVRRSPSVGRSGNNPTFSLQDIRQEIAEDPQKLLQYIQLSQMRGQDGKLIGYRVRPGKNRVLFESVGLKSGDIATHINGEDLTDSATMGRIWKSLSDLTELNLTVDRKGQAEEIYIQF